MSQPKKKAASKKAASKQAKQKTVSTAEEQVALMQQLATLMAPALQLADARNRLSNEDLILSINVTLAKGSGEDEPDKEDIVVAIENQVTISNALESTAIATAPGKVENAIISGILEPCMSKVFALCTEIKDEVEAEKKQKEDKGNPTYALPGGNEEEYEDPRADADYNDELVADEVAADDE